jgi:hypothetical protein
VATDNASSDKDFEDVEEKNIKTPTARRTATRAITETSTPMKKRRKVIADSDEHADLEMHQVENPNTMRLRM